MTTIFGIAIGVGLVVWAIFLNGTLTAFLDGPSLFIVLGGTIGATLIHFPARDVLRLFPLIRITFSNPNVDAAENIDRIVHLAEKARREGLLAMEEEAEQLDDDFLRNGVQLVVDGTDPDLVRNILNIEINQLTARHERGQTILESMGTYSPAFGMIGTLVGLINMLGVLEDPSAVGPGMALALITTLYGVLMANLIFLPMAGKLRSHAEAELLSRELSLEGVLSIQAGENPRIVEQKLKAFVAPKQREADRREAEEIGADRVVMGNAR